MVHLGCTKGEKEGGEDRRENEADRKARSNIFDCYFEVVQ